MNQNDTSEHKLMLAEVLGMLVADGMIEQPQADALTAARRGQRHDSHPLLLVAEQNWKSHTPPNRLLHLEALTEWMALRTGLGYFHIDPLKIDFTTVTDIMSSDYAARFGILPVQVSANEVVIATSEPFLREWEKVLKPILRKDIRRVVATPTDISRYLVEFYNLARSVKSAEKLNRGGTSSQASFEQLVEMGKSNRQFDANDQNIVHIVDWLWQYAFEQRASDIHMEPRRELGIVRFRIDGVLHQVYQVPMSVMTAMTSRIKVMGRMDLVEKRRPQDGRIKTRTVEGQEVELRLSTLPTAFGEKLVMRIFDPEVLVRDFAELGFSEEDLARWRKMTEQPNGIILVTGPTGSGKTTTLYSTLKHLATPEVNVCTIEDPIEMVEPAFNQMQVQHGLDLGFADGVRALMRQDPDIIMIGEIRDLETAEMAIQAALTGHLVLSTLHTNDAPSAITRLIDLGVAPFMINATLLGVMGQRLVRTLCPHCKKPMPLEDEENAQWDELVSPWKAKRPAQIHQPEGCLECRMTGYKGRVGIYEILLMSPGLRKLVTPTTDIAPLREMASREGMKPLRISGALKVASGLTTLEEVVRVAPPASQP
jgi:general secretion pathway protein E